MWRARLNTIAVDAARKGKVKYWPTDRLEVAVRIYMDSLSLRFHDVDNRLKDILDALQGRAGGPKAKRSLPAVIPNDSQIYRVLIEKSEPPDQSHGLGHLVVRKLRRTKRVVRI